MPKEFYDQYEDGPMPADDPAEAKFFTAELGTTKDNRLSMADAVTIVGVFAILFAPFTIALATLVVR